MHSPARVKNDHGWCASHPVRAGDFPTEFVEKVQAHNPRLSLEIFFNPIHDGLCDEASRSSIREEIYDDGLPTLDYRVEFMP